MLYKITDGTVSAGGQEILSHINFEIKGSEKIAVVGANGAGKTSLLRLIAGELELDADDKRQEKGITCSRKLTIEMLSQNQSRDEESTVEELFLACSQHLEPFSKEQYLYEVEYNRIFTGFGFKNHDKKRKLKSFSGGEKTKIALIRLLLKKPDIMLLDEPTNHLDIATVEWLEDYMKQYPKAVVFVSHDRFFLDQVVDVVYELEDKKLVRYVGSYSDYRRLKQKNLEIQRKAYERQQEEIKRLNQLIEEFKHKPKKAAFARSRKTILERMEKIPAPKENEAHIFTGNLDPLVVGSKWVLEAEHLKVGYDRLLFELSLRVRKGQKLAIIGENGAGKTTFLKTIAGLIEPLEGSYSLGNRTVFGYFDQQSGAIESEKKVVDHFHDLFPNMTEKELRQTLGAYLFKGKDTAKRVSDLSGGEKARLVLAEILTGRPNLLLLDEPTNHMDIPAKETLESALKAYTGTLIVISHDRYFVNQVADAILLLEGNQVYYYPFGYEHYLKKARQMETEDICGMIQAEDQALVAGLKAVPKKEYHSLKEQNTEEAYEEWKLGLQAEPMLAKMEERKLLEEQRQKLQESIEFYEMKEIGDVLEGEEEEILLTARESYNKLWKLIEEKDKELTELALAWYDLFLELGL